jgi:hypothetical protein
MPSYLASESLRVSKAVRSPLGRRPRRAARSRVTRIRHKRTSSPVFATFAGAPPFIPFRRSRALDRTAWFAVVAGFSTGPLPKKICTSNFYSKRTSKLTFRSARRSTDTIALYSSPIHRLTALGPEALTETDTLSLLLDASDSRLAVWRTSPQQYADEINRWKDNW